MATPLREADRVSRLARAGLDHVTFEREADAVLRDAIGYDLAAWATIDPVTLLVTSCTPIGDDPFDPGHVLRTFELEYLDDEPLTLRALARRDRPVGALRTELDDVGESLRYREILGPAGVHDELMALFTVSGRCWGALRVYRYGDDQQPFTNEDLERVEAVTQSVAEGLRLAFLHAATRDAGDLEHPPGMVTIDGTGRVTASTEHADALLASLAGDADSPALLTSLAARVAVDDHASAVVAGTSGPVAFHASRLQADTDETAIIVERPRPLELTPRIMDAYHLTPRETEVTQYVLRGSTTAQIAQALELSQYTVQDHLKSVFAKVGVQTRGELANELHVRFYLPPRRAGASPSPYGFFLEP